mgnify:FL=1
MRIHLDHRNENEWDLVIPGTLYNLRRRQNPSTGVFPSKLLYGADLQMPGERDRDGPEPPAQERADIHAEAQQHQERYIEQRRKPAPSGPPPTYEDGARVLIQAPPQRARPFAQKFSSPYRIIRRIGESDLYEVDVGGKSVKCHTDRLRPATTKRTYTGRPPDD